MIVAEFPTHVQIQTTVACGAACSICPHPVESPTWTNGTMSAELFERLCDQLAGHPIRHLSPYLMADPLSDKSIFDRIARLRAVLPDTHIEVSTTGLYLVPRLAQRLLEAPLGELRISSHGITAAEYARTMPGVDFGRAMPQIERFIAAWRVTQPYPLSIVSLWGLWPREREAEIEAFWAARGVALSKWRVNSRSAQVDLTVFGEGSPDPRPFATVTQSPPFVCRERRATEWLHVLSDGRVTLCCMDYGHKVILGNLAHQTIAEIWHGPAFSAARTRLRDGGTAGFLCERCEWRVNEDQLAAYEAVHARQPSTLLNQ